ncbi:MAG: hypothetical protein ABIZ56_00295, partial [Chthoniobacteraceae bacterium]
MTFDPILPIGLIIAAALALAILTALIYARVGASLSPAKKSTLATLRVIGIALVVLLLLQPSRLENISPLTTSHVTFVAVDNSRSMAQRDVPQGTRTDAARTALADAALLHPDGTAGQNDLRLFKFGANAAPITNASQLDAADATTRVHTSVSDLLGSLRANESARAIVLLTDGHDFEAVNPAKTGFLARGREAPIFVVATGRQGQVRDVAARITSYLPYTYVKQKARITASLRLIGCELETVEVDLWRDGKWVQQRRLEAGDAAEMPVEFEVTEPAIGQYEYEIRVRPLEGEVDRENNAALTYLNVIDQQIQVLVLEGSPYWDSTFLQRSLMRNEKMNVDVVISYGEGKTRVIRKKKGDAEFALPKLPQEWRRYDLVVLGRDVDRIIGTDGLKQLDDYAKNQGGTVIFSRGPAFGKAQSELEPVIWGASPAEHVRMTPAREGQALAPFRALAEQQRKEESLPDLIAVHPIAEKKTLAATLATAQAGSAGDAVPAMIHRRFGEGQVLSVGVDGLWRWAFNARVDGPNTFFDRFWDQMILWLMAGRDFAPAQKFSLRASSANIPLGEKIYFRAIHRDAAAGVRDIPLVISQNGAEVGRTTLATAEQAQEKLAAEFLPAKPGKYEATAQLPGAKTSVRFFVFEDNPERTEVALDLTYLKRLSEASGGRIVHPDELSKVLAEL